MSSAGYKRIPTQVVVAAFTTEEAAYEALKAVKETYEVAAEYNENVARNSNSQPEEFIELPLCSNAIIARKSEDGKSRVKEYGKPDYVTNIVSSGLLGGATGAVIGAALTLALGPAGVLAGAAHGAAICAAAGASTGAILTGAARKYVEGMSQESKQNLEDALQPGTSILVLVFGETFTTQEAFQSAELQEVKSTVDECASILAESINQNLEEGRSTAHLFAITEDGIVAAKALADQNDLELSSLVLTNDGVAGAAFAANHTSAAAGAVLLTEDAIFAKGCCAGIDEDGIEYEADGAVAVAVVMEEDDE